MIILWFHKDTGKPHRSHKKTKSSYLPQMTSEPKNKGTFFSSTLKVEEGNSALIFMIRAHPGELC